MTQTKPDFAANPSGTLIGRNKEGEKFFLRVREEVGA
jgi:hypothetical protein